MGRYIGSVTIRDAYGRTTRKQAEIIAINDDAAFGRFVGWVATLDNIIRGCIEKASMTILYNVDLLPTIKDNPQAEANVDVGATFHVLTKDGNKATIKVPTFNPDLADDGGFIDIDNLNIYAFLENYRQDTIPVLVSDFERVDKVLFAVLDKK